MDPLSPGGGFPLHQRLRALVTAAVPPAAMRPTDHAQLTDEAFVVELYRELLGREPDATGLARHVANLAQGTPRPTVRQAFLASPEYRARHASHEPSPASISPAASARAHATTPNTAAGLPLAAFPPANPIGAHGLPNYLQTPQDGDFVLDLLARTGARHTVLIVPFPDPAELREVDRTFLRKAQAHGVTVQLRLGFGLKPGRQDVSTAALARYTAQVKEVLGYGPYVAIGNEPNLADEWAKGLPDPAAFARWWAPYALAVHAGGGFPGLPGLAAGSYDTPDGRAKGEFGFYRTMLATLVTEAPASLERAWTGAHPYHMYADAGHADYVEDVNWQLERFDALNREVLGRSLPVLVGESGYVDGANARRLDPNNAQQAADVARHKAALRARPPWLLVGTADWLISNRHGTSWHAMYGPQGEPSAWARVLEGGRQGWQDLADTHRA